MATDTELLAQVESVIEARLSGQATDGFNVRNKSWTGTPTTELFKIRDHLKKRIESSSHANGGFSLIDPIKD